MSPATSSATSLSAASSALAPAPTRRKSLQRERVFETALAIVDAEGLAGLTMRRLAAETGVTLKTLYTVVQSKEEVLGGAVDAALSAMSAVRVDPESWDAALVDLCLDIHAALMAHPAIAQLAMVQRRVTGPGVLRLQETFLRLLRGGGLEGQDLVNAYMSFISYVTGFTLLRITRTDSEGISPNLAIVAEDFTAEHYPELHAVSGLLTALTFEERLRHGVRQLLHGLAASPRNV
jgi:AcrR family transcriptional regulator